MRLRAIKTKTKAVIAYGLRELSFVTPITGDGGKDIKNHL